ncbi:MAG TPA: MFS transporter, partial [Novosphingobium sp.]|nr:MFS transporter [Novosphingobium sp.]
AQTVWQALPATMVAGGGWGAALTTLNFVMQMRSPAAILGRCLSIYQAVTFGGMAVGSWIWGVLADWQGLPFALHAAGVFLAVSLVVLHFIAPMPDQVDIVAD